MLDFWKKYNPTKTEAFLYPSLISVIISLIAMLLGCTFLQILPIFSILFAFLSKIFDTKRITNLVSNKDLIKREIYVKVCIEKIIQLEKPIEEENVNSISTKLTELESYLNEVWKCCYEEEEKQKFKKHKGLIGSLKTSMIKYQMAKLPFDFSKILEKTQLIKEDLHEL